MLSAAVLKPLVHSIFWSCITIGWYFLAKRFYRHWPVWWLMPVALSPILIGCTILLLHANYQQYFFGTQWLSLLIGPLTIAFAIPIYEQRDLIRQYWLVLVVGASAGSLTAIISSWALALAFGIEDSIRLSLIPRSISTPFAMTVSRDIGGVPELTAIFVVVTGVLGAIIGKALLTKLSFRSALAKGALLGIGAHAAGTAHAQKIGATEGAIASLVMILAGLLNVLLLPVVLYFFS